MLSEKVVENLRNSSAIRAMFEEGAKLKKEFGEANVFDFSLGNPDPDPPEETLAVLRKLVSGPPKGLHAYMNNAGYADVRAKIAEHLNREGGAGLSAQNVVMSCGAGGGLNVILKALLNPGEEVVIFAPFFVEYKFYTENHGGKAVIIPTDENFLPDLAELEKSITPKTKALILNTPNNPTGVVYPASLLADMEKILQKKGKEYSTVIYLISDEPYREIVYDGLQVPPVLAIFQNAIVAYSFSKSLSLPGERIGYVAASNRIKESALLNEALVFTNRTLGFVNAPSLFQRVAAESLEARVDITIYRERRDMLYNHLSGLGFSCVKPGGAFYLFPRSPLPDTEEFKKLALKHKIILVPGKGFGCPEYFRLAYCVGIETIRNSLPAFTALAKDAGL
ncbi:MAG: pyridoxal phosphate-dependent aminotransferase [Spirochaetaceae bacterium]|nr:pyridoxal phosphate-dependent aminotransferase [Spirochaetaceae bacterium]